MNFMIVERKMSVEVLLAFRAYLSLLATVSVAVARSFEGLGRRFTQIHATSTGRIARFSGSLVLG